MDPESLNPDPDTDPAFQVKRDPDPDPDLDPKLIQGLIDQKLNENPSALKTEHPALQKMKVINLFSMFVGHFCPPGSRNPIDSGSNQNADPQQH